MAFDWVISATSQCELQLFDVLQNRTKTFVVRDSSVGHALIHIEDFVGQRSAFGSCLKPAVHEGVGVDIFADDATRVESQGSLRLFPLSQLHQFFPEGFCRCAPAQALSGCAV